MKLVCVLALLKLKIEFAATTNDEEGNGIVDRGLRIADSKENNS